VDPIPASVQRFLIANINSVDQLEILRLLAADHDKRFSAAELAKERQVSAEMDMIERQVRVLAARGLLTVVGEQPLTCQFGARSSELETEVQAMVDFYVERPVSIIRLVYEHEKQVRSFAEAFRLKGGQ
jgi:hypothetical protein